MIAAAWEYSLSFSQATNLLLGLSALAGLQRTSPHFCLWHKTSLVCIAAIASVLQRDLFPLLQCTHVTYLIAHLVCV